MAEKEVKYKSKREILSEGWKIAIGSAIVPVTAFGGLIWYDSGPLLHNGVSEVILASLLFGSLPAIVLGVPTGATQVQTGYLMESSRNSKMSDIDKAQLLVGAADIGGAAVITGLVGAAVSAIGNHDAGFAGLWLGTVPMSAVVTNYLWQKARNVLRR